MASDGYRKVYTRKGIVHVPFRGGFFRAPEDTHASQNGRYRITPKLGTRTEVNLWLSDFIYETWILEPALALCPRASGKPRAKAKPVGREPSENAEGDPDYYSQECYWRPINDDGFIWHGTRAHYWGFVRLMQRKLKTPFAHEVVRELPEHGRNELLASCTVAEAPDAWLNDR